MHQGYQALRKGYLPCDADDEKAFLHAGPDARKEEGDKTRDKLHLDFEVSQEGEPAFA